MGAGWASSTPLSPIGYTFALALFEQLHARGEHGDWAIGGDGRPVSCEQIGARTRLSSANAKRGLAELVSQGVAQVREDGAIGAIGWRDAALSDPVRAARNRRYRENRRTRETDRDPPPVATRATSPERDRDDTRGSKKHTHKEQDATRLARRKAGDPTPEAIAAVTPALARLTELRRELVGPRCSVLTLERDGAEMLGRFAEGATAEQLLLVVEAEAAKVREGGDSKWYDAVTPFRKANWAGRLAKAEAWDARRRPANGPRRRSVDVTAEELAERQAGARRMTQDELDDVLREAPAWARVDDGP